MNIISKLTLRHLLENKRRTIVTILGIATSTALITAIIVGIFSVFKFFGVISVHRDGNVHVIYENLTKDQVEALRSDERTELVSVLSSDVDNHGVMLDTDAHLRYRLGNVMSLDADGWKQYVISEFDGKAPENSGEIAVEEQFLKDNKLDLKIGDKLKFKEGNRYYIDEKGEKVCLGGNYRSYESFETFSEPECTITAILHGNSPSSGYDILRCNDGEFYEKNYVRVTLKKCDHTALKQIHQMAEAYGLTGGDINDEYMLSCLAFEKSDGTMHGFFSMMAVALAIVMVTSVILIYNAFGMSLAERMRYLGMLASVGATGGQKRGSVYFEGFILGLIGIPVGILLGLLGTNVTLTVVGKRMVESHMFAGYEGVSGSVPMVVKVPVILVIIMLAAVTIFISSVRPALKASKVMPVDALRQTDTINVKGRKLKINPIIKMIFGYEGELAYKNIKRNGIKSTVITITIAVSVVMFLTINYFCDAFSRTNYYDYHFPFQVLASCSYDERDKLREEIMKIDGVDEVVAADFVSYRYKARKENTEVANTDILNPDYLTADYKTLFDDFGTIQVVTIEDKDFDKLLKMNGLSRDKYYGDTLRGVLLNNFFMEKHAKKVFNDGILGQKIFYDNPVNNPPAVEIGDFIDYDEDFYAFGMIQKGSVSVFVPYSMYYEKAILNIDRESLSISYEIKTDKHEEVYSKIIEIVDAGGYHNTYVSDMTESVQTMDTVNLMLKTAIYGFTILLTLITIANIVNTISTGVLLRRKEFAMYRSVGMTGRGFKKMIYLETLLYGLRALVTGIPVSIILSYLMYRNLENKLYSFEINYMMYLIVIAAVFAVVGLSMLLSVNKIKDDTIIEALKIDSV